LAKLLNLACGQNLDPRWINLDQNAASSEIKIHDLKQPLPFSTNFADAIYCSHFLEHLDTKPAANFLKECFRCLKPKGILRIVVPDLEKMVRDYLGVVNQLQQGQNRKVEHSWMHLEIFDQFSRNRPEGLINPFLRNSINNQNEFIKNRLGLSIEHFTSPASESQTHTPTFSSCLRFLKKFILYSAYRTHFLIKTLFPKKYSAYLIFSGPSLIREVFQMLVPGLSYLQIKQAMFRNSGEVHLQSFDQYNLKDKLMDAGFKEIKKVYPNQSYIPNWKEYFLDMDETGKERKADSLYMEAKKASS
jgi:SAM-dependent methyltransferase